MDRSPISPAPHGLRPMRGRATDEAHRVSSPLELFYDLTVVVAVATASAQLAHSLSAGHLVAGLSAFCFAMFAVLWAWLSFTWFASAYDTDDWGMRLATILQMVGVVILSLGLPALFHGMETHHVDNRVMVGGYVVMRVSMIALWLRAAAADRERRPLLLRYAVLLAVAQVGWVVLALLHLSLPITVAGLLALFVFEIASPRWGGPAASRTPWHPHHIAERYGLMQIITLGEIVLGTTTAVGSVVDDQGWSVDAALVALAGVAIAAGIWWNYFVLPFGEILERAGRGWMFGLGHLPLYAATAAVGAGLHVAASRLEGESSLSEGAAVLAIALPVEIYMLVFFWLVHRLLPGRDRFHLVLVVAMTICLGAAVLLGWSDLPLGWSLVLIALAPWLCVIGYETRGHGHVDRMLARLGS